MRRLIAETEAACDALLVEAATLPTIRRCRRPRSSGCGNLSRPKRGVRSPAG